MTMDVEEIWKSLLHPKAVVHMVKEVSKVQGISRMKTKCGLDARQTQRCVGTIWWRRVTCQKCIKAMAPAQDEVSEEVVQDEDIEW